MRTVDQRSNMTFAGRWTLLALVLAPLCLLASGSAQAAPASKSALTELSNVFSDITTKVSPAVVHIEVEKEVRMRDFGNMMPPGMPQDFFHRFFGPNGQMPDRQQPHPRRRGQEDKQEQLVPFGQGTGFILSEDGYIVTNHHVVGKADRIRVRLDDGRGMDAEIIGSDPQTEIAVIKIEAEDLPTVPLGDSDSLRVGDWVLAIGNPFGLSQTVTAGIVSAKDRGNVGITDYADFIQTDAAINPGNSGGPLLNLDGKAVGLNTAIYTRSGGYMGIGFAIPAKMVKYVTSQLIDNGEVTRGFLGVNIQNLTPELAEIFELEDGRGIIVADIVEDTPADKAGLKQSDVIVEYDGQPVEEIGSFRSNIASTAPGSKKELIILRDGKRMRKMIEIGTLDPEKMPNASSAQAIEKLGFEVENLADEMAERLGYEGQAGVLVSRVNPGSGAARKGLKPGMLIQEVNREPVHNVLQFTKAIATTPKGRSTLLLVLDGESAFFLALELN